MLRKILDFQLSLVEEGRPLHRLRPLISAADTFLYEAPVNTTKAPHIRDAVDLKRWMSIVVLALIPAIFMAIWNAGIQKLVYSSGDYRLMDEFLAASSSFKAYMEFASKDNRYLTILQYGLMAFIPVMIISYAVGGLCEGIFACVRGHEIAEGFLVTGMLYPLILPPTIPYWMVAFGVAAGVILSKELFGGTGQNILNPALTCRALLFFTFPNRMSGDVWVGTNPVAVRESLGKMNADSGRAVLDGFTQATPLAKFNISDSVKRIHVDAIATNTLGDQVGTFDVVKSHFQQWQENTGELVKLGQLNADQLKNFVTAGTDVGGLALPLESYADAFHFASLNYGVGHLSNANFFFGNQLGSFGETSAFACLIGAAILLVTRVGSWRSMAGMIVGALITAFTFQMGASFLGMEGGAWNPAKFALPAYKHLLLGGFAFGCVFMTTDPVSSPSMPAAKWIYGLFIGVITIVIRTINPAYPEGVMLAILLGNVFAPLIDFYAVRNYRSRRRVPA